MQVLTPQTRSSRVSLTDEQNGACEAVDAFMRSNTSQVFTLHGLAGTGKTTVLATIKKERPAAILCTLTGKAASVLNRKTGAEACTIHSVFYQLDKITKDPNGKRSLHWREALPAGAFRDDLILLDECSMVDRQMAADLLNTGAKIIACGDPGQLPPVKGQAYFSEPDYTLKTIHRQAWDSPIIRQAHAVREGRKYQSDGARFCVAREASDDEVRAADVILCWTNKTRIHANTEARKLHGYWQAAPQAGEPVMCLRNNRDYGIYNGAVYTLAEAYIPGTPNMRLDLDGELVTVRGAYFEGIDRAVGLRDEEATGFTFGYAMTVHKAQGSEFSNVVLLDEYNRSEDRARWLYTGLTRAADSILVVHG